jgi:hypothetical protein
MLLVVALGIHGRSKVSSVINAGIVGAAIGYVAALIAYVTTELIVTPKGLANVFRSDPLPALIFVALLPIYFLACIHGAILAMLLQFARRRWARGLAFGG